MFNFKLYIKVVSIYIIIHMNNTNEIYSKALWEEGYFPLYK